MVFVNVIVTGVPAEKPTRCLQFCGGDVRACCVAATLSRLTSLPVETFFLLSHGHIAKEDAVVARGHDACAFLEFRFRRVLPGGKGGFGAMLRGVNASKKTTNYGACRDLSGRRLRDIEDERRFAALLRNDVDVPVGRQRNQHDNDGTVYSMDSSPMITPVSDATASNDTPGPSKMTSTADAETLKEDLESNSHQVVDAVAEGFRAARAMRKLAKRSKKRKLSHGPSEHHCCVQPASSGGDKPIIASAQESSGDLSPLDRENVGKSQELHKTTKLNAMIGDISSVDDHHAKRLRAI